MFRNSITAAFLGVNLDTDPQDTSNAFQTKMWRYDLDKFRVNTGIYSENDLFFRVH